MDMRHFFYTLCLSLLLFCPVSVFAAGPLIYVDLTNDAIEIRPNENEQIVIQYADDVRDLQAMRIEYEDTYYVIGLRFEGDAIHLFLYDAEGTQLAKRRVFKAPDEKDFTVMKLDTAVIDGKTYYRVRAIRTNAADQPVMMQTSRFKVVPTQTEKKIFQLQKYKEKKIVYPTLNGLTDAQAGEAIFNYQRMATGVFPVPRKTELDAACALHAEYMRVNEELTHYEDEDNPGYTEDGDTAGGNSNLSKQTSGSMIESIDILTMAIYHRFPMVSNALTGFGYALSGTSATKARYGCLDIYSSSISDNPYGEENNETYFSPANHNPLVYPGVNQTHIPTAFNTGESPDPLAPFGADIPVGYPISIQFSALTDITNVSIQLFDPSGTSLPGYFRAPDDPNDPNLIYQLNNATFFATSPLHHNTTYTVKAKATLNGSESYSQQWQFTTE